ncbi:protein-glutamate O-methyltransferase CheR [bacterium]|nr:protein-glutamate O-methyltransferase CheR [bacterium]
MNEQFIRIKHDEYILLRDLIYKDFGIVLPEQKKSLIEGRLQRTLRELSLTSFKDYYDYLIMDTTKKATTDLVNNITTNHTFFYREQEHFKFLFDNVLPEMTSKIKHSGKQDLRIWSAGCSSGEEPYTLISIMMEFFKAEYNSWNAGILATDISNRVLTIAKTGIYSDDRVNELPPHLKQKYFKKLSDGNWEVKDFVKKEVTFAHFNLMTPKFVFKKPFHVIFCRNVMIYFDQQTREELAQRFYDVLEPGGYLFIGHSESLGRTPLFKYVKPSVYQK